VSDPDLARLGEDLATLQRDVARLMADLTNGATNTASGAGSAIGDGLRQAENLAAEASRAARALGRQVEDQPVTALLIAAGVGYVAGRLLSR
jgi:ElaB/YqjD/DUF883 family membrane-anchored ribosome-binding protein